MSLNVEYVNPFLEAASSVFKKLLDVELRRGKLAIKENPDPSHDVAIIIGITGAFNGEVVYSMNFTMVEQVAGALVPGLDGEQMKNEWKDIIGEVANMITGNAMNLFSFSGSRIEMTTPTVVEGKNFKLSFIKQTTIGIMLYSPFGQLEMNVALKK